MIYEQDQKNWFSKPGDSIRAVMTRKNVNSEDMSRELKGGMNLLRSLLDGSCPIDDEIAVELSRVLGASPSFWIARQKNFENALDKIILSADSEEIDNLFEIIPSISTQVRGKITASRKFDEVRKRLVYFGVCDGDMWKNRYGRLINDTAFRTSQAYETLDDSVLLWLRRGEMEADMVDTRPWNSANLEDRLEAIKTLSLQRHPQSFLPKLRTLLAEAGVALSVVRAPSGCRASGATRLIAPDKAMLLMSFRHRADDHFWFTLFHEMGHLILHNASTFVDGDLEPVDHLEDEANNFAKDCIIPKSRESEFLDLSTDKMSVLRFSATLKVAPGLTVGQLQRKGRIGRAQLNFLKRNWSWDEIGAISV
ncbi:ImmA/IrrE family metallo-endopeptidase [Ochrobactrum quorumnocens]|nr:ImmA/IrrE family metallo-endopeptidase [[Ochrobactrum] quorumnocens]